MFYCVYVYNGMRYILFKADEDLFNFASGFSQKLKIHTDFGYEFGKVYELESKQQVTLELANVIINDFRENIFKIIKTKISSTSLVMTAYTKSLYTTQLYLIIISSKQFVGTMEELYESIQNNELTETDSIVDFKIVYPAYINFKNSIIKKIEEFDKVFLNNDSTLEDLLEAIDNMKNLYQQDPYTFLKENIYK